MSPCESGDNPGEPSALEEQRGPLPLNKTLFLGYAFLLTMATTSDKLASRSKLPDGPTGSSEEEEGKALRSPGGSNPPCASVLPVHSMNRVEEAGHMAAGVRVRENEFNPACFVVYRLLSQNFCQQFLKIVFVRQMGDRSYPSYR